MKSARGVWDAGRREVRALVLEARRRGGAEAGARLERAVRLDPNAALRWDAALDRALGRGDAAAALRRLDALRRTDAWALVARAETLRLPALGRYAEAAAALGRAREARPDAAWVYAFEGRALFHGGRREEGLAALSRALELDGALGWGWAWRGEARRAAGDARGAAADLDRAAALAPGYAWTYAWRGGARRALGRHRAALADLDLFLSLERGYAWAERERARVLRRLGRVEASVAEARRWGRGELNGLVFGVPPDDAEAERLREAAEDYERLLRKRPGHAWARALRGDALVRLGAADAAAAELEAALARARLPWAAVWLAEAELLRGRHERAAALLDSAPAADAGYGRARVARARLARRACDFEGAAALLAGAGRAAWVLAYRGECLLRASRPRLAELELSRALELEPGYAEALAWRGEARRRAGRPREAAADYRAALAARPDQALARLGLALLPAAGGRR